jgi:hypothetical protein
MRRERCTITARLAGPCACCRQAAWPVHAQSDGRILCARCCGCGRGGAQAAGTDAAPATIPPQACPGRPAGRGVALPPAPGATMPPPPWPPWPGPRCRPPRTMALARATGRAIAPAGPGKARSTADALACVSGAVSGPARAIVRGDPPGAALAFEQAPGLAAAPEIYFPPARSMPPAPRGRSGYRPPPWPAPLPQGLARENVSAPGCSGHNFTEEER